MFRCAPEKVFRKKAREDLWQRGIHREKGQDLSLNRNDLDVLKASREHPFDLGIGKKADMSRILIEFFSEEKNVRARKKLRPTANGVALNDADVPLKRFGHGENGNQRAGHR